MARYIDADLLLAEVEKQKGCFADGEGNEPLMCWEVADLIHDQDTADVEEVKHGEWKKISVASKEYGYGQVYYQHSNCKISPTELYQSPYERCPRCGAKMDAERSTP